MRLSHEQSKLACYAMAEQGRENKTSSLSQQEQHHIVHCRVGDPSTSLHCAQDDNQASHTRKKNTLPLTGIIFNTRTTGETLWLGLGIGMGMGLGMGNNISPTFSGTCEQVFFIFLYFILNINNKIEIIIAVDSVENVGDSFLLTLTSFNVNYFQILYS